MSHLAYEIYLCILFLCFLREGKLQKIASHSLQASSIIFPTWNSSELFKGNLFPHFSQTSPICSILTCLLNSFPIKTCYCNLHIRVLASRLIHSVSSLLVSFKLYFKLNLESHKLHLNSSDSLCTASVYLYKLSFLIKFFPQSPQQNLETSCVVFLWCKKFSSLPNYSWHVSHSKDCS